MYVEHTHQHGQDGEEAWARPLYPQGLGCEASPNPNEKGYQSLPGLNCGGKQGKRKPLSLTSFLIGVFKTVKWEGCLQYPFWNPVGVGRLKLKPP